MGASIADLEHVTDATNLKHVLRLTLLLLGVLSCVLVLHLHAGPTHSNCLQQRATSSNITVKNHSEPSKSPAVAAPEQPEAAAAPSAAANNSSMQDSGVPDLAMLGPPPYRFPKLIHQTVKDKSRLSCEEKRVIDSWKRLNPGYTHRLWDDDEMRDFMVKYYPELVPVPWDELINRAERPDVWRVLVLHKFGGVYADIDVECLHPIDEWNAEHGHDAAVLLGLERFEGQHTPQHVQPNNWALAAMPGHPLLGLFPKVVARQIQKQYFSLARLRGRIPSNFYEDGVLARTGPAALKTAMYEFFNSVPGFDLDSLSEADFSSSDGVLAGGVRVMPVVALSSAWEVAAARQRGQKYTCADVRVNKPAALVCHMFWGSWRSHWGFRPRMTYNNCD